MTRNPNPPPPPPPTAADANVVIDHILDSLIALEIADTASDGNPASPPCYMSLPEVLDAFRAFILQLVNGPNQTSGPSRLDHRIQAAWDASSECLEGSSLDSPAGIAVGGNTGLRAVSTGDSIIVVSSDTDGESDADDEDYYAHPVSSLEPAPAVATSTSLTGATATAVASAPEATPANYVCSTCSGGRWYVVFAGTNVGVFDDWSTVQRYTSGVSHSCYKKYSKKEDAEKAYKDSVTRSEVRILPTPSVAPSMAPGSSHPPPPPPAPSAGALSA
ncbi:hypothetical protein JR316_0010331 [Psilocybe cubensis]|uniref:Ribonuclease H1 N-terminal domain-containing protein n=2 Tax=Psilocybe cubensis TaxID=181762 RepID=A0A8H8CG19_PSICU|nr:hypothetical protein JR316_0010331 [Psilocybe cubensis]KAH9478093.1 hypothetical protein JR316_0010331 [Psilocybe cubensis]